MIRVYFDLNMFSYLRTLQNEDTIYKGINNLIISNKYRLLIPYSPVHLQDLLRNYGASQKSIDKTEEDLNFIYTLSAGQYLCENYKQKDVSPGIQDPRDYFQYLYDNKYDNIPSDFKELFEVDEGLLKAKIDKLFESLKSVQTGVDIEAFEKEFKNVKDSQNILENTKKQDSLYNLLNDVLGFISEPEKFWPFYKDARNNQVKNLKIETNPEKWKEPVSYINKILRKNNSENIETFEEIARNRLNFGNDKNPSRYQVFTNHYILLDTYGYFREADRQSLINDAAHAYYGAYCDYFVTKDRKAYNKAKTLYKHFNIETKVCFPEDFPRTFAMNTNPSALQYKKTNRIGSSIMQFIKHSLIVLNTVDNDLNPARVYKLTLPFIDFFNRMQLSEYGNSISIFFYKKQTNYSGFLFWNEFKHVIEELTVELGVDINFRSKFEESEKDELIENKWKGRLWHFENTTMELKHDNSQYGLILVINFFNLKI